MQIRRRYRFGIPLLVLVLVFATLTVRLFVRPALPPVPARTDAIVLLGGPGNRSDIALGLALGGAAPVLVQSVSDPYARYCVNGIPELTVVCFHPDPNTTQGEAEFVGKLAAQRHWHSILLVVTPDQAWRARLRFARCFSGQIYVITAHLPAVWWVRQIPYQWGATVKALTFDRGC